MKLNIRTRLTLQFTYIVALILILFSLIIYYFSASYRESAFYSRLEKKANNTAKLLIVVEEVDHDLLKIIDRNTIDEMYKEKVMIFDYKNKMIYNSLNDDSISVTKALLDEVRLKKNIHYHQGKEEVIGLLYTDKYDRYVVLSSALDVYGWSKLNYLKWILIVGFLISIVLSVLIGRVYAGRALRPMSEVVKQVDNITISSLHMRVNEGNRTDEIALLAITFNHMLERLESAFEMQKSFVSNASHELRTPLTSITGQIEVSLMKSRSKEEYETILESVLEDIKNLNTLSNGLLGLARVNSDNLKIALSSVRIDEILWLTRDELLTKKKDYHVSIQFRESIEDEKELTVHGNQHLLKTAFLNLMDNACKYSADRAIEIFLSVRGNYIVSDFADNGIGIDKSDLDKVFQPFYRGNNARNISGHGLGLPLTEKIVKIHSGTISIDSILNKGTKVTISIPFLS